MYKEISNALKARGIDELARHKHQFFQAYKGGYGEGDKFIGVDNPNIRKVASIYRDKTDTPTLIKLVKSAYHEERLLGLVIMERQFDKACKKKTYDLNKQEELYNLYFELLDRINNWNLVDLSAPHIVGRYLSDKKDRSILYQLASSGNLWQERISVISTRAFIKNRDFTDTLKLSKLLLHHEHDLMHKAVGWMLREVGKLDLDTEFDFLQNNDYRTMPRTALRYAIEKFPEDLRQQYLKGEA